MSQEIERSQNARGWIKILTSATLWKTSVPHPFHQVIARSPVSDQLSNITFGICSEAAGMVSGLHGQWERCWQTLKSQARDTGKGLSHLSGKELTFSETRIFKLRQISLVSWVWSLLIFERQTQKDLHIYNGLGPCKGVLVSREKKKKTLNFQTNMCLECNMSQKT